MFTGSGGALSDDDAFVLVLAILREGRRHGYEIAREVERRSERTSGFRQTTLYFVLHEMEDSKLISSQWECSGGERRRRVYNLTEAGRAVCDDCLVKFARFAQAADKIGVSVSPAACLSGEKAASTKSATKKQKED